MKKTYQIPFIVTTILAFVFVGAFAALSMNAKISITAPAGAEYQFIRLPFVFNYQYTAEQPISLWQAVLANTGFPTDYAKTLMFVGFGTLLIPVLMIILACAKVKKGLPKATSIVLSVLVLVLLVYLVCFGSFYITFAFGETKVTIDRILIFVIMGVGFLAIVGAIISLIFGMLTFRGDLVLVDDDVALSSSNECVQTSEAPDYTTEPEPEVEEEKLSSGDELKALLKEIVRDMVRDEIARSTLEARNDSHTDNHSIVGATFAGPLVVQYFNGGVQSYPAPSPAAPVEEKPVEPEPVVEEKPVDEEKPVETATKEEPVPELVPVVEEVVAPVEPVQPKDPIIRIPFQERMINAEKEMQDNYNIIKNEILSYGVKSRISNSGDTFRLHRKTYIKLTIAGKSLKLYFALDPNEYKESTIPTQDAGEKNIYAEIPLVFKVKSELSVKRCKQLIQDCMEKDNLEQGEVLEVNWVKELKAEYKPTKKED